MRAVHSLLLTIALSSGLIGKASLLVAALFAVICEKSSWELTAEGIDINGHSIVAGGNQDGGLWV